GTPPQREKVTFEEFAAPFQEYRGAFGAHFSSALNPRASALTEGLFARLDRNKDGKLSKEEIAQATASLLKLDLDDDEAATQQAGRFGLQQAINFLNQAQYADSNRDGYIDAQEAERYPQLGRSFKAIDRDGDGKISTKELLAYVDGLLDLQGRILSSQVSLVI